MALTTEEHSTTSTQSTFTTVLTSTTHEPKTTYIEITDPDDRPSAKGIGIIVLIIVGSIFGGIVLLDIATIGKDFERLKRNVSDGVDRMNECLGRDRVESYNKRRARKRTMRKTKRSNLYRVDKNDKTEVENKNDLNEAESNNRTRTREINDYTELQNQVIYGGQNDTPNDTYNFSKRVVMEKDYTSKPLYINPQEMYDKYNSKSKHSSPTSINQRCDNDYSSVLEYMPSTSNENVTYFSSNYAFLPGHLRGRTQRHLSSNRSSFSKERDDTSGHLMTGESTLVLLY